MKKINVIIVTVLAILITVFIVMAVTTLNKKLPMEIQGQVEAPQIKMGSKLPGRIDSLSVKKGQEVKKGDFLYKIVSPEVEAKLTQVEAMKMAAKAQQAKASNGARKEDIQAAYNTWQKAKAAAEFATKSFERINNLFKDGVVSEQRKDEVEMKMKAAQQTEKAAKSIYNKAKTGARNEDKAAATALVEKAEGALKEVNSYLNEIRVIATQDGEVSNIIAEEGELVPTGFPVVTLVDLKNCWITFNVREDFLTKIKKGKVITAKIPAIGNTEVDIKITYINVLPNFATWTATKTSGDFDMKTFEVHAEPVKTIKDLRPGMSVIVNWDNIQ
ncbi:MAG: hemolysin secretion protein D [Draconibacterium sp.]|nr:MAG: hemolysin secretion protein D [Draconibacterium sp.]